MKEFLILFLVFPYTVSDMFCIQSSFQSSLVPIFFDEIITENGLVLIEKDELSTTLARQSDPFSSEVEKNALSEYHLFKSREKHFSIGNHKFKIINTVTYCGSFPRFVCST